MIDKGKDIRQSRKIGGSTILPLTGYIEEKRFYSVSKIDNMIIIKEVKLVMEDEKERVIKI